MAFTSLNLGATANDGTGDTLRAGGQIINDNFALAAPIAFTPGTALTAATAMTSSHAYKVIDVNHSATVTITVATGAVAPTMWGYYYQVGDGRIVIATAGVVVSDENKSAGKGFMLFWWCNSANNIRTIGGVE